MKKTLFSVSALILTVSAGCSSDPPPPVITPDPAGALRSAKLETLPEPVSLAFRRDHPTASITSIELLDAASGLILYEINYMQDGRPGDTIYRPNGRRVRRSSAE